ncbi:hypothetical protein LEP1GSC193_1760 [Leptospira alstonii serovar Pingchang str. 80-412]|uniref:Uncharacterized protein n=1 Tax=Leptospira alstonii serovar Pingchang str. 80-412 TaxID=1218564 RepID=T0GZI4_9LEPT|nr:hypothetical protein LEP1GSC193_1760 [Leptospira alstonii serovar Pingchang str. 80-412]
MKSDFKSVSDKTKRFFSSGSSFCLQFTKLKNSFALPRETFKGLKRNLFLN